MSSPDLLWMVRPAGFEPATLGLEGRLIESPPASTRDSDFRTHGSGFIVVIGWRYFVPRSEPRVALRSPHRLGRARVDLPSKDAAACVHGVDQAVVRGGVPIAEVDAQPGEGLERFDDR